jgi:hypothetical protein
LSRKKADLVFSLALLGIVMWMTWEASHWDARARMFPFVVGLIATAVGFIQVFYAVRGLRLAVATGQPAHGTETDRSGVSGSERVVAEAVERAFGAGSATQEEEAIPQQVVRRRSTQMILWIVGIAVGVVVLGFELGSAVTTFLFLRYAAREKVGISIAIGVATYLFFFVLFDRLLHIPFPAGLLSDALGLEALDHYVMDPLANLVGLH